MKQPATKILIVRPKQTGRVADGDNVVHTRAIQRLSLRHQVEVIEMGGTGSLGRAVNLLLGAPPELARHIKAANRRALRQAARDFAPDVICLFNETTFPLHGAAKKTGAAVVLYAHNVHSQIMRTEKSLAGVVFGGATRRFERRVYGDPAVSLVCISKSDAQFLEEAGIRRNTPVAAPGAPKPYDLSEGAGVEPALVLSGSYGWWRKKRDLTLFAAEPADLSLPCYVTERSASVQVPGAQPIEGVDWTAAIRVGVITDRFVGGFKLKSTEYVSMNCAVASYADIGGEFEGLPHAEEFVRLISTRAEAEHMARSLAASGGVRERFVRFKTACIERFDWSRTLDSLEETIDAAARRDGAAAKQAAL